MEFCSSSTIEIYINFQDLHIAVNIYTSKKSYVIITKHFKKRKKGEL